MCHRYRSHPRDRRSLAKVSARLAGAGFAKLAAATGARTAEEAAAVLVQRAAQKVSDQGVERLLKSLSPAGRGLTREIRLEVRDFSGRRCTERLETSWMCSSRGASTTSPAGLTSMITTRARTSNSQLRHQRQHTSRDRATKVLRTPYILSHRNDAKPVTACCDERWNQ